MIPIKAMFLARPEERHCVQVQVYLSSRSYGLQLRMSLQRQTSHLQAENAGFATLQAALIGNFGPLD